MFLTADELEHLTGYVQPAAQIRWLKSRRYRYEINAVGHPVVARAWVIDRADPIEDIRQRPNLRAIPGRA